MKKAFVPLFALILLISIIGAGAVTAGEDDDQIGESDLTVTAGEDTLEGEKENQKFIEDSEEGVADLAVDYIVTDMQGNPKTEISVGDEIAEIISAKNLGPDDATGVWVSPWLENAEGYIDNWAVSWDGGETWVEKDPSLYWNEDDEPIWDIKNLPVDKTYLLALHTTIDSIDEGSSEVYIGATIYGDQYDPDESNNEAFAVLKVTAPEPVPEPVKAGEVPMQPTGAPLALAILSVLMTLGGLLTPKIK